MLRRSYLSQLGGLAAFQTPVGQTRPGSPANREGPGSDLLYSVRSFGAKGDGKQFDTEAIQHVIDSCASQGGGVVHFPKGHYLCRSVVLKSNVSIHLAAEARILASGNVADYSKYGCILFAADARQISVTGTGTIDGRGAGTTGERYKVIRFERCEDVLLEGVELRDSSEWCTHLFDCRSVWIHGLKIDSAVNPNNDGLDIDSCQDVRISDCRLRCGDDAIALKTNIAKPCRNITITNCVFTTRWAAFRFGPEARGNFENITVANCVIHDTFGCGIKLQMNEGARMRNILFDNLLMENVTGPISLRLANWSKGLLERSGNENRPIGVFENVRFSNIRATIAPDADPARFGDPKVYPGEARSCISMTGLPGHPIEGITFSGIHITFPGGGTAQEAARRDVPDLPDTYPEYFMFGTLPAYGMYIHHTKGIVLHDVRFEQASADLRPALVCDDVDDLELTAFRAQCNAGAECLIRLQNTRQVFVTGSRPLSDIAAFVRVEGSASRDIGLSGNDLRRARRVVDLAAESSGTSIVQSANLSPP